MIVRRPNRLIGSVVFAAIQACATWTGATDLATLQQNYVDQKYGIFLHFNMGTFTNEEWAHGGQDPSTFDPTGSIKAGTDQWAATAKAAGMTYGVLTTKHHDGFALWDTSQGTYDIASTPWYNDPASQNYHVDIVKSYADSFRAQGLGVGLYYSIWDKTNGLGPPYYSNDPVVTQKTAAQATTYVEAELHQLLTNYGPIDVLWTDGWQWQMGYSYVNYSQVYAYIKQISPNTLLMENNHSGNLTNSDIVGYEQSPLPPPGNTLPSEVCATIAGDNTWFYHASSAGSLKSASYLGDQILTCNARKSTYLLDVPPDQTGQIPAASVQRLMDVKAYMNNPTLPRTGNLALGQAATQSSTWANSATYAASQAVSGDNSGDVFAHTAAGDYQPWWMVNLGSMENIGEVDLYNRPGFGGRLRDITVQILAADGTTVLYTSTLLNPGNTLGGGSSDYANGPNPLTLLINNGGVLGQYLRVSRSPEAGFASDGSGNTYLLTLAAVEAYHYLDTWTGKSGGNWNTQDTNWLNAADGDRAYADGTDAKFLEAAATQIYNVNIPGTVTPGNVTVENFNQAFTFGGTGSIAGSGTLTKNGSGTLVINNTNGFTGPVVINNGTVVAGSFGMAGSNSALGAGSNLSLGDILHSGTLEYTGITATTDRGITLNDGGGVLQIDNVAATLAISGAITGGGRLTKNGSGILLLTGSNTFGGGTTVNAGRLVVGEIGGPDSDYVVHVSGTMNIAAGATLEFNTTANIAQGTSFTDGSTTITGSGTLVKSGSGDLGLGRYGTVNVNLSPGALVDIQAGDFEASTYHGGNWGSNYASLNVATGADFDGKETNVRVDGLTGGGHITSGGWGGGYTFTIGDAGGSGTFSGQITDPIRQNETVHLSLTKTGSGIQVLSGSDTYTGGTDVVDGTLILAASDSIANGTNLTVGADASAIFAVAAAGASVAPVAITVVPEPGTLVLLLAGLATVFGVWRRKRRALGPFFRKGLTYGNL